MTFFAFSTRNLKSTKPVSNIFHQSYSALRANFFSCEILAIGVKKSCHLASRVANVGYCPLCHTKTHVRHRVTQFHLFPFGWNGWNRTAVPRASAFSIPRILLSFAPYRIFVTRVLWHQKRACQRSRRLEVGRSGVTEYGWGMQENMVGATCMSIVDVMDKLLPILKVSCLWNSPEMVITLNAPADHN